MSRKLINILLFAAFVCIAALNWMVRVDYKKPNRMFFPEMVRSIPYNAFAANPNFADGKTLQQPPPKTIAQGYLPLYYPATEEGAVQAGEELVNRFTADSTEAKERGAYLYKDFCLPCHGPTGMGDGAISLRGFPPPPSLSGEKALAMKDGQIFHLLTFGQGNMPDYRVQISRLDRWKVILHVRELQARSSSTMATEAGL